MGEFGGNFIVGDTTFKVSHKAYLELEYVLDQGVDFMFTGETSAGDEVARWVSDNTELNALTLDPGVVGELSDFDRKSLFDSVHDDRLREGRHLHVSDNGGGLDFGGW
jgi:hypothetical protein